MKASMNDEDATYHRSLPVFRTTFALEHDVFNHSIGYSKDICEQKTEEYVLKQNDIMDDIDEYTSGLPSNSQFKNQWKEVTSKSYTVDELNSLMTAENERITNSNHLLSYYRWNLNEKDKTNQAWEIMKDECDVRNSQNLKKKKVTVLSQEPI